MRANRRHGGVPPSGVPSSRFYKPMANGEWDSTTNDL